MSSIKKNYIYNTTLQLLMMVVPLITTPYLSRVIGAEGIGTYSYYYAVASYYILFIKLGIDNYGNRAVAEHRNNPKELNKVFSELVYLQFILGIIVSSIYLVYSFWLSSDSKYAFLFFITIIATCLDINWFLYGMEEFKVVSIRNAVVKIISTVLIFLLVKDEDSVFIYCLILNVCTLLSQLIAWPLVFKRARLVKVGLKDILKHVKPNMILFMSLISVSIFKTMDKIMLGLLTPGELEAGKIEVGLYESAERIVHIPNILVTSLGTVMMPRITNMIASNDCNYKKHIFVSMVFSMAVASSMSFGIMGVAKEFVPMYYGKGFEKCISLYLILLPCCIFMSFATVIRTQYLLPNHKDKSILIASISGAVINLIINWILIPVWGSIGAAIATLASEAVVCLFQVLPVRNYLNTKKMLAYSSFFVLIGLIMFACINGLFISSLNSIMLFLIKVFIGVIVFFVGSVMVIKIGIMRKDEDVELVANEVKRLFKFKH